MQYVLEKRSTILSQLVLGTLCFVRIVSMYDAAMCFSTRESITQSELNKRRNHESEGLICETGNTVSPRNCSHLKVLEHMSYTCRKYIPAHICYIGESL